MDQEEELFEEGEAVEAEPKEEAVKEEAQAEPAEPKEEAQAEPTEPPKAEEPKDETPTVPLAALHEVRDSNRELKAELERLKQQNQPEPETPPDMFEDPQGWQAYQAQQFQSQLYAQRLDMSRRFAEQQHGQEAVEAAYEWGVKRCSEDPHFNNMVQSNPDPYGFVLEQHRRESIASEVNPSDYEQFKAWKAAQEQLAPENPTTPAEKPPKSIASAPSAGGVQHIALGEEAVFDEEFDK